MCLGHSGLNTVLLPSGTVLQLCPGTLRMIPWPVLERAVQTFKKMESLPEGDYCN